MRDGFPDWTESYYTMDHFDFVYCLNYEGFDQQLRLIIKVGSGTANVTF